MDLSRFLLAAFSYVAGGIPTGYLIAKQLRGIDIREHGSGNPGAANVYRTVGKGAGIVTLAVDALKGFLPVTLAKYYYPGHYKLLVLCGALAILGHVWTIFLRFKGGKAVATSAGVFLALSPKSALFALIIFGMGVGFTGHISVGSMAAAALFPFIVLAFHSPLPVTILAFGATTLILIRHIPNLKRLLQREELHYEGQKQDTKNP
jgi:acyl phosphate:glycerol-3-phosphate acyltransferase